MRYAVFSLTLGVICDGITTLVDLLMVIVILIPGSLGLSLKALLALVALLNKELVKPHEYQIEERLDEIRDIIRRKLRINPQETDEEPSESELDDD